MTLELKVPSVGESITEVQIGEWLVPEGQSAQKEQSLVVIETDKVSLELPAPESGTVLRILKHTGEKAFVGEVIGTFEAGAVAPAQAKSAPAKSAPVAAAAPAVKAAAPVKAAAEPRVMPAAARALHDAGLGVKEITPSGPGGRVLKEDVQHAAEKPAAPAPVTAQASGERHEEVVPMTPLRKRIAQRLVEAQNTAALLTTVNEIDMTAVLELRKEHQEAFVARHGVKLGFMSFFVKASIEALAATPQVNAEIRGESIVYRNYYDIGIAIGGGKGLVVPILRNAERLSFAGIESAISELGARAQNNKLTLEELSGGTFTISNGGVYGSLLSTPIVNPPQSGILGLHAIQERPVARAGQVVIRPMMYVALTYDHRLVDGREAVTFLKRIKECVENPARMLLEV
ncbi:MAG: 2-oxoglutarate dehydrogenase complex dihydrolipoyllysine-residue succinyltransferase [Planctomycetes bacterium]|nr:2-oxoglutarate dehydrogenase complex dihydrolipoyllysine-residue succinyltransferase [Planctomycetota bacterium]